LAILALLALATIQPVTPACLLRGGKELGVYGFRDQDFADEVTEQI
jgi:hypothetical protein